MEKEALTSQVLDALEDVIDPELGIRRLGPRH